MQSRPLNAVLTAALVMATALHCSDDTRPYGASGDAAMVRLYIAEQTGTTRMYSFDPVDPRLFQRIDNLGPDEFDMKTCNAEYYDIYFSTVLGEPLGIDPRNHLPEPVYITVRCLDGCSLPDGGDSAARWEEAGNNIDALTLMTKSVTLFGRDVTRVRYGACDEPLDLNQWPACNALGPPDERFTHLGGSYSSMTIRMDFIERGNLTVFERSNTPSRIFHHTLSNLDPRLFEKLPNITQVDYDLASGDCELYDIYFSTMAGEPLDYEQRIELPEPLYLTIDCIDLDCDTFEPDSFAVWSETDWSIDALRLSFGGWHRFAGTLVRARYGACGEPTVANRWPAENMLGIPDSTCARMGGGFSSVTVELSDTTS